MGILANKDGFNSELMTTDFHFPNSKNALIVLTRNPELGKCKTRLAATIGNVNALEVYKFLLNHTATIAKQVKADRYVYYSEVIQTEDLWEVSAFRKKLQQGADLGDRMHSAFSELFQMGYEKVLIIGSDLLDLESTIITDAFNQLNAHDVVIGPALDGGYYLLGMKTLHENIFRNKDWGTNSVLKQTLDNLKQQNLYILKELNDIDTFEDMQHYEQLKKFY